MLSIRLVRSVNVTKHTTDKDDIQTHWSLEGSYIVIHYCANKKECSAYHITSDLTIDEYLIIEICRIRYGINFTASACDAQQQ